jgi:sigma-B regulation protein RsbU (phosphoserine phosphatase)
MHAALFMALTRSIIRATTLTSIDPEVGLTQANRLICADSTGGMFVTLFYAEIDPITKILTYVNCGHNPPLWYQAKTQTLAELTRTTLMLGFMDTIRCEQKQITMEQGDLVVFYTDGITEAFNVKQEQFGEERLKEVVMANAKQPAELVLNAIRDALRTFTGMTPQSDDLTIVIAKHISS